MRKRLGLCMTLLACAHVTIAAAAAEKVIVEAGQFAGPDAFAEHCAVCHGDQLQGAPQGTPLTGRELTNGDSVEALVSSISTGNPAKGMPAWSETLEADMIKTLAMLIVEHRLGLVDLNIVGELNIPVDPVATRHHRFNVETIASDLDAKPYAIAVRPDGSIVVTEKMYGVRIVTPDGSKSALVAGTPQTFSDVFTTAAEGAVEFGAGWLLDVALHPDYARNGWVYLHYTERCETCNAAIASDEAGPTSRNVLVRGRLQDGRWRDQQVLWRPDVFDANYYLDVVAGGRIAFDPEGFVFITVGMRSMDAIQDLRSPYGKTHRLHDDGRVPTDNPFVGQPGAFKTIWTYGHRSPQGLAFDPRTRDLWGTEHGPRGGDELNRLKPGGNYGWPLYSLGQNYDGTEVAWGRAQSEVALDDIEQPVVSWTPSIAVSNLVVYEGGAFPQWQGQLLLASLNASDLYRVNVSEEVVEQEMLIENIGRVRDVDVDNKGYVYLLLEHAAGSKIVRLVPDAG